MALSRDGDVYSWGNGDGGRLGHGDTTPKEEPTLIQTLKGRDIVNIECGGTYSAAISAYGALYTWGRGNYGRLGHGTADDCLIPTMISSLSDEHVTQVACGFFYAHTLCVTSQGKVYSWGDGDYGKLGRGGSDGSKLPRVVEKLQNTKIRKVYCGPQCSIALSEDGKVFTWGNGDCWKLGHPTDEHVRFPELVEALQEKRVVDICVGLGHIVALCDSGEVYGWGKNANRQLCDTGELYVQQPKLIDGLKSQKVVGICCGPAQTFAWTDDNQRVPSMAVPFIVDLNEQTFR